jgi:hypothetical protein
MPGAVFLNIEAGFGGGFQYGGSFRGQFYYGGRFRRQFSIWRRITRAVLLKETGFGGVCFLRCILKGCRGRFFK